MNGNEPLGAHRAVVGIGAALLGVLLATDCTQPAAGHCDNNGGDSACAKWYPDAPYCWVCTGMNQGCGEVPPTDPSCIPGGESTSVASTATDASTGGSTTAAMSTSAGTTEASADTSTAASSDGSTSSSAVCGDGNIEAPEVCDGDDVGGLDCEAVQLGEGMLGCADDCLEYDVSDCAVQAICGDGIIQGNEDCDGTDVGDAVCTDLGSFIGGELGCNACAYDTTNCEGCHTVNEPCETVDDCCSGLQCGLLGLTDVCSIL